jgi:hypothetical protein
MLHLLDTYALLGGFLILFYASLLALLLTLIGLGLLLARRWVAPTRAARRRGLKRLGLGFLIPGLVIPATIGLLMVWPAPEIVKTWDFSVDTRMPPSDESDCWTQESGESLERHCSYEGNITVSIRLPHERSIDEKAVLVWVDGVDGELTSVSLALPRSDLDALARKLEALIARWDLARGKFDEWREAARAGERGWLSLEGAPASAGTPRLSLEVRPLEPHADGEWALRLDLDWVHGE